MPSEKNLHRTWTKLRNNLRVFGPVETARAVLLHVLNRPTDTFDRRFGVATSGDFTAGDVTSPNLAHGSPYQPTHERVLAHLLRTLPIEPSEYSFVDLGCGMGRALLMASELPFERVLGIEFSPSLCAMARDNVGLFRERHGQRMRCEQVDVVCDDVCNMDVPRGNVIFYLFNPFALPVLTRVLDRIDRAAAREPRDVLVAYCNSQHGTEPLEEYGCRLLGDHRMISSFWSWSLWSWPRRAASEAGAGQQLRPTPFVPQRSARRA